jgi:MFS-type transporter involved in bile tolerance (Atg22 family)
VALPQGINPYLFLMVGGFVIGVLGHIFRSKVIVAVGVFLIFLATLGFPLAIHVFEDRPEPPPGPQFEP